jgi:hypothetical protein
MLLPLANALLDIGTSLGGTGVSFVPAAFEACSEGTDDSSLTTGAATVSVVAGTTSLGATTGSVDTQMRKERLE